MAKIDYVYKGEWNIPFKYGFTKRGLLDVNLHVFEKGHVEIELNLMFRDYLRTHKKEREDYAKLKIKLLQDPTSLIKHNSMFTGYNLGKNDFIMEVLKKAGFNKIRFLKCTHHKEWAIAQALCHKYFSKAHNPSKFNDERDNHFILYQGVKVIGYAHTHKNAIGESSRLSIMVLDEAQPNLETLKKKFARLITNWLENKMFDL